jgi:hypothetical protein
VGGGVADFFQLKVSSGVKLLDFGLARMVASPDNPTLTMAGEVMGTPA